MKDVFKHIEITADVDGEEKKKVYPFVFNINVIQSLTEKYGDLEKWAGLIKPDDKDELPDFGALKFFCKEAINEGIDMENDPEDPHFKNKEPRPFINEKQAARIITAAVGFNEFALTTVMESNDTGKEKNVTTEQNQNPTAE